MGEAAPLPADGLAAVLQPFGSSVMLPQAAYLGEEVLAWERRHFFAGAWTCLGRTAGLAGGVTQRAVRSAMSGWS